MAGLKLGVLISGRGSNLQALIDAAREDSFPAAIALVISNEPSAPGLARAEGAGLPTRVIDHREFADRVTFERALDDALRAAGVELVCLAGFMRLLGEAFVESWHDRLINVHPSLLPAFKGLHTHERVISAGVRITGCTVHFVRPAMDAGPIIVQGAVPVRPDDDPESLAARVLEVEHRCYPLAVRLIAEDRVAVVRERVEIRDAQRTAAVLINPAEA